MSIYSNIYLYFHIYLTWGLDTATIGANILKENSAMSKFNSYLLTVLLSLATAFICIQSFGPVQIKKIEAASSATVNAVQQGMIGNDKTDNTPILQKFWI